MSMRRTFGVLVVVGAVGASGTLVAAAGDRGDRGDRNLAEICANRDEIARRLADRPELLARFNAFLDAHCPFGPPVTQPTPTTIGPPVTQPDRDDENLAEAAEEGVEREWRERGRGHLQKLIHRLKDVPLEVLCKHDVKILELLNKAKTLFPEHVAIIDEAIAYVMANCMAP